MGQFIPRTSLGVVPNSFNYHFYYDTSKINFEYGLATGSYLFPVDLSHLFGSINIKDN